MARMSETILVRLLLFTGVYGLICPITCPMTRIVLRQHLFSTGGLPISLKVTITSC
ncbi:hypothetical protein PF005_g7694 [Phytophthora fragariae]|uniref:Uncharacterized protein n=1 Tax=Phytophthora fragariae TaxID=53985 RepID=A0A6A3S4D3_9STRA|nr:hypothetical protein PF003_g36380 [Phytophthora fragariae]KAE8941674.1 hypothetical protein PF009_g8550 [Phytophthora fragariae]KAE9005103.1 hypothetical protein PF011_g12185 [Phytophthora fragariae]KAE9070258.1 hypothetical protein PF006_g29393 [Phytophthora fragariae]KAE9106799.1 hypothetical protein PF010_g12502 [Phytophthora fragariae]